MPTGCLGVSHVFKVKRNCPLSLCYWDAFCWTRSINWLFCIIWTTFVLQNVEEYYIWDAFSKWSDFCKECKISPVLAEINSNLWRLQNLSLWLTSILCLKPCFSRTPQSYMRDAWWFLRNDGCLTRASKRHFHYNVWVTKGSSTRLVVFQAYETNRRRGDKAVKGTNWVRLLTSSANVASVPQPLTAFHSSFRNILTCTAKLVQNRRHSRWIIYIF